MVQEPEFDALLEFRAAHAGEHLVTSALARTELQRAALRPGEGVDVTHEQAQKAGQEPTGLLRRLDLVRVGPRGGSTAPERSHHPQLHRLTDAARTRA